MRFEPEATGGKVMVLTCSCHPVLASLTFLANLSPSPRCARVKQSRMLWLSKDKEPPITAQEGVYQRALSNTNEDNSLGRVPPNGQVTRTGGLPVGSVPWPSPGQSGEAKDSWQSCLYTE